MTDKQIIIDNADVSECESFCNGICCKVGFGDDASCKLFSDCHYKNWKRKEQECEEWKHQAKLGVDTTNRLTKELEGKEQECERLKWYMQEIRNQELSYLDIELDEYETHCIDTEYSNIINLVEEALEERSPEDCRYGK